MKIKLLLPLIFFGHIISAQNCDFTPIKQLGFLNATYHEIDEIQFKKVNRFQKQIVVVDEKSEKEITEEYPEIFKSMDSCYTLKSKLKNDKEGLLRDFSICKNIIQSKAYSDYEFIGIYAGNALISYKLYEYDGYYLVNLNTGFSSPIPGEPISYDGKIAFSFENYYGEEELVLTHLKSNRQFILRINNWQIVDSRFEGESYYFKLETFDKGNCGEEFKYLKIELLH